MAGVKGAGARASRQLAGAGTKALALSAVGEDAALSLRAGAVGKGTCSRPACAHVLPSSWVQVHTALEF